ncbi:MAG TPA: surface-adhesin E family protein [Steroidobacteraceae bacterium]|nr:surface-adhesin E family protein [Steroidobacteraceae bacterium]
MADPPTTFVASFDCSKAATRVERLICSSADVSDLDTKLASAFQELLRSAGAGENLVRDQQRNWLRMRNGCATVECVKEQYAKRLSEVNEFVRLAPNSHWVPMNVVNLPLANGHTYYADFIDRESLRQVGRLRSVWTLMNYTEPRSFRNRDDDYIEYRSLKVLEYFDCEAGKMADARDGYFSGEMGGGNEVLSDVYSTSAESLRWEQFDVNGAISSKVRLVCGFATPSAPSTGGDASGAGAGVAAQTAETASGDGVFRFRLTRGKGTEVCDAYLKRLRATHFERPPYCGRPENNVVPGFAQLQRDPLSSTQVLALENRVFGLMSRADQYWMEHEEERWKAANSTFRPAQPTLARVDASLNAGFLKVWRYEPPIDVENNGGKDNLIVWFGEDVGPSGSCGTVPSNIPEPLRMNQLPFFLTAAGDAIDVDRTMKVFGVGIGDQSAKAAGQISKPPEMIGSQFSFFEYNGVYYFDTFPNAASIPEKPGLADTLAVFLHKDGQTHKVCEYSVTQ